MSKRLQSLVDEKNQLWTQMTDLMEEARAEKRDLTAEEAERFDKLEADIAEKSKALRDAESSEEREWRFEQMQETAERSASLTAASDVLKERISVTETEEYRKAWLHWMRYGREGLDGELRHVLRHGYGRETGPDAEGQRAQTVTTTGGGYLIPEGFRTELIRAMSAFGGMRANSRVMTTESGNTLDVPTVDDTSNTGRLLTINTAVTETAITFGQKQLNAYKYSSDLVLVPVELMEDSAFDMNGFVNSILAERLGRITETHYTTGDGSSKPNGVVSSATLGKRGTTGQETTIIADDLVDLFHSVDPAYRDGAKFMMNDSTVAAVRKLKTGVSGDQTYLWQPGLRAGLPDTLLGREVIVNQNIATMADDAISVLFGNFMNYTIRDVRGIRFVRLDERYADIDQVGFVVFLRTDSDLLGPSGSIKYYQNT